MPNKNLKSQISNLKQYLNSKVLNFKSWSLFGICFLLFGISLAFFAGRVYAADAFPAPRLPCPEVKEPVDYSSDRPLQAAPCGDRPVTYWCSNNIVIDLGSVKVPYCDPKNGALTACTADIHKNQKIDIDLTNVQLPIAGNTQLPVNAKNSTDQIDDGTKVSNYVAWYLNGTNDKAEYGFADPKTAEGVSKIVDSSGPLKKLLPSIIQDAQRIATIKSVTSTREYTPDADETENPESTPQPITEYQNHNQIVVCGNHEGSGFWAGIQDILGLGKYTATPCYNGSGGLAGADLKMRLLDWNTSYKANIVLNAVIQGVIQGLKAIYPFIPEGAIEKSIGDHWSSAKPPLPWSNKEGKPFASDAEYRKAYQEWRGDICAIIPIINQVVCLTNSFVPTKYSDLYPYIPLANTVDKHSTEVVNNTHLSAPRATIECEPTIGCYQIRHSAQMYVAHALENYQLTNLLKSTYKPGQKSGKTGGASGSVLKDVEDNSACRIIPSRTNPGDDTTFDNPKSHMEVDVSYHVTEIECTTPEYTCTNTGRDATLPVSCKWTANCSSEVYAGVSTSLKGAYIDELWGNTVAGSDSVFRRIYPKTGAGSPVSCIADTPASSNATYTLTNRSSDGLELLRVVEPDDSVVKSQDGRSADAQFYWPHYGGILDYFLNGIQQALRPQGYGTGTPENGQYCSNLACGELPKLPKASGSCALGNISSKVGKVPQSLKDIINAAAQTYKTPPSLILGIMFGEGLFEQNRFNWTDQNVKNWATCQKIPNCNETGDDNFMGFNGSDFENIVPHILPDIQKLDPNRKKLSQCNLLDTIYAEAYNLHATAAGGGGLPATCFGIPLTSSTPTNCSWSSSQYEAAIKVAESGYTSACLTKEGSCLTGGGLDAACPDGDNCETVDHRYANPSHNACVWDVATEGGSGNRR